MTTTVYDNIGQLVTNDPALGDGPLGIVRGASLVVDDGVVVSVENPAPMRSRRASDSVVSPYPDLISIVVIPARVASARRADTMRSSSSSLTAAVAATVSRMPPAA